jgi:hypothetical protein
MSKGPGRVQRAILGLIEAEPDGAWTIADLCRDAYPGANQIERKHRVAVLSALRRLPALPGTWRAWNRYRRGTKHYLCDPCNERSLARVVGAERARALAAEERRWRDASPAERIDIQIQHAQQVLGLYKMAGTGDPAVMREIAEDIMALQAERDRRKAAA